MAHVLVAHADEEVRDTIAAALRDVAGHRVLATSDGVIAIAVLWLSERPMVALMDERLAPFSAMDVLRVAANDRAGQLSRHRFVVLSTWPEHVAAPQRDLLTRLDATVLGLPYDLAALLQVVDEAQGGSELVASLSLGSPGGG